MTKKLFFIFAVAMALCSCKDEHANLPDGLYAEITTSKGVITCALEYTKTPVTVANFVTLAEGKNDFVDPRFRGRPFYNGLKFHRVIPNFMIQGGDPLGNGSGDAGYKFKDEFTDLTHDKPGILSMANSGPNTNSSQFFITHVDTPWLDGKHTIFGHVVENGMETVNKIVQDDAILSINIIRKGEAAKKFDAVKVFSTYFASEVENQKKQAAAAAERKKAYIAKYKSVIDAQVAYFEKLTKEATKLPSGLSYIVVKKGNGKRPAPGTTINLNYAGFLEDGTLFDTSLADAAKKFGTFDAMRAAQNGYAPLPFLYGRKDGLIPGFIEGLDLMAYGDKVVFFIPANLAYGEAGAGEGVIPPNANLIFELELLNPTK